MTTGDEILGKLGLLGGARRVLVVEDQLGWLFTLTNLLEARGHIVVPMIGIIDIDAETIQGLAQDGSQVEPNPRTSEIDAVFLDFNFAGNRHNGASFLQVFRQHSDAPVIGMSSDRGFNDALSILGATMTMQKQRLKYALFEG